MRGAWNRARGWPAELLPAFLQGYIYIMLGWINEERRERMHEAAEDEERREGWTEWTHCVWVKRWWDLIHSFMWSRDPVESDYTVVSQFLCVCRVCVCKERLSVHVCCLCVTAHCVTNAFTVMWLRVLCIFFMCIVLRNWISEADNKINTWEWFLSHNDISDDVLVKMLSFTVSS